MNVNHELYGSVGYEQEPNNNVQLGDVLYRNVGQDEIGVVIQVFRNGDFRTDMWGVDSYATFATEEQVKEYRPELLK